MKALIIFESTHGCAEKCAALLKDRLLFETDIVRLKENPKPDLSAYHVIIIGGSIHMGEINTRIKKFCSEQRDTLKTKILGLYVCCIHEGDTAIQQFEKGFHKDLRLHAKASGIFGGEFNFRRMNAFEKTIVKKIAKVDKSVSRIREDELNKFADKVNKHSEMSYSPVIHHHKDIF